MAKIYATGDCKPCKCITNIISSVNVPVVNICIFDTIIMMSKLLLLLLLLLLSSSLLLAHANTAVAANLTTTIIVVGTTVSITITTYRI